MTRSISTLRKYSPLLFGITPGQGIGIEESIPNISMPPTQSERDSVAEALQYMKFEGGSPIKGKKIDVAFIGSCTNGRLSDFQEVARYVKGHKLSLRACKLSLSSGSQVVAKIAEDLGLDKIFIEAGFEMARSRLFNVPCYES